MNNIVTAFKRFGGLLLSLLPTPVPTGMTEFDTWSQSIIDTFQFKADDESVRFTLATMIMHQGPLSAYVPKLKFALMMKATMAKQIAAAQFQQIKQRQNDAEAARKAKEATTPEVASDGHEKQGI